MITEWRLEWTPRVGDWELRYVDSPESMMAVFEEALLTASPVLVTRVTPFEGGLKRFMTKLATS